LSLLIGEGWIWPKEYRWTAGDADLARKYAAAGYDAIDPEPT
jgi:hypothetical protein